MRCLVATWACRLSRPGSIDAVVRRMHSGPGCSLCARTVGCVGSSCILLSLAALLADMGLAYSLVDAHRRMPGHGQWCLACSSLRKSVELGDGHWKLMVVVHLHMDQDLWGSPEAHDMVCLPADIRAAAVHIADRASDGDP